MTSKHETGECLTCFGGSDRTDKAIPEWRVLVNADGEPYAIDNGSSRRGVDVSGNVEPNRAQRPSEATPVDAKRIPFWRVRPVEGGAWLYETTLSNVVELIETETSENHALVIEKTSLTEEEAANMGEFDGW